MAVAIVLTGVDGPYGRLLAVARPVRAGGSADRVPAWLMLPVIMAPAECEPILRPDDLGAHGKARGFDRLFDLAGVQAGVPDVGDRSRKERPGFPPIVLVIVDDLAELQRIEVEPVPAQTPDITKTARR